MSERTHTCLTDTGNPQKRGIDTRRVCPGPGGVSAQTQRGRGLKHWQAVALGVLLALLAALLVLAAALYLRSCRRAHQAADSKDSEAGKAPGAHQVGLELKVSQAASTAPCNSLRGCLRLWVPVPGCWQMRIQAIAEPHLAARTPAQ